ncbi:hypothetical protein I4U23_009869 [Adineta vaga]|nr:hypothetical protein I4U23_009869 [Adineta vaga]
MNSFSFMFIIFVYRLKKLSGKIIFDQIDSNLKWNYLTKFSFHPIYGHIHINFHSIDNVMKFFVFNQQEWKEIKDDLEKVCEKKEFILQQDINQTNVWTFSSTFTTTSRMYFIIKNCNSTWNRTDLFITYQLILTNGKSIFTEHFSHEERGLLELYIVNTIVLTIILLITTRLIYLLKMKSFLIMKLYLLVILCSWLNSLIHFIHILVFSITGNSDAFILQFLLFLARFFALISQICFLLVLILCAKGYWIMKVKLRKRSVIEILLIILICIHVQIVVLILTTIFGDRIFTNEKIFVVCGYLQVVLHILMGFWFVISLLSMRKHSQRKFYCFLIFSIWFVLNAIVSLLTILDVLPNPEITILRAIEICNQFVVYCVFLFILREKSFFIRTKLNQINVTYIDPIESKLSNENRSTQERINEINICELTNLCSVDNTRTSRYQYAFKSSDPLPRLEPRRDVTFNSTSQTSLFLVPRQVIPIIQI